MTNKMDRSRCPALVHVNKNFWIATSALCGTALYAGVAFAQSTPTAVSQEAASAGQSATTTPSNGVQVQEIIVTARRSAERLQSTPIAVTAVTAQELKARSVNNLSDLSSSVPSLHASANAFGGNNSASFFIRGVGQIDVLPTTDPGVGVYIDGVYLARTTGDLFDLADIQQVEVLRGPQGTLFGKNTSGGAISVTTRRPTGEFGGLAEVTVGNFRRNDYKGVLDFPIIKDKLAGSLALISRNEDGYGRSLATGQDLGNINLKAIRGALNFTGPNNSSFYVTGDYSRSRDRTNPLAIISIYPNATRSAYYGLVASKLYPAATFSNALITADPLNTYDDTNVQNNLDVGGVSGIGTVQVGSVTLKSISAYRAQRADVGTDTSATPVRILDTTRTINENQETQEFQALGGAFSGRLKYVAGLFYEHEDAKIGTDQEYLPGSFAVLKADQTYLANAHQTDDSYAAYANLNFKLTEKLGVTAGLRYSAEHKDIMQQADYQQRLTSIYTSSPGGPVLPLGSTIAASRTFYSTTPTLGLQYQATHNAFFYATFSKGFKSGGFDARPIVGIASPAAFGPEKVTNYEVGSKLDLFDRRVRLNTAAFWMDYDGLQVQQIVTVPSAAGAPISFNEIQNAGSARIRGVEIESTYIPVRDLELTLNSSFLDAQFTRLNPGATFLITDHLQQTPKWTVAAAIQYTQRLHDEAKIAYRVDYDFTSTIYNELPNTYGYNAAHTGIVANGPLTYPTRQPSYGLLNSRITYTAPGDKWTIALFGTNLTDQRYISFGFSIGPSFGESLAYFGRPREYGVQVTRRF